MAGDSQTVFTRLADGTILVRRSDGSFLPVDSDTDRIGFAALGEDEIEHMAATDPDHPALDDVFWTGVDELKDVRSTASITLDDDVLAYFLNQGRGYQTLINGVLRRYVAEAQGAKNDGRR